MTTTIGERQPANQEVRHGEADARGPDAALDQLDVGEYSVVTLDGGGEAAAGDDGEVSWRVASEDELRELLKDALATKAESAAKSAAASTA